ncbi:MAG: AbrB/MazE/SpoVT family DNA-binding domain-containing protein [Eubacteriales bacterium]
MKDMVRNIDQLGRIVLPVELRKQNGLEEGDGLIITVTPDGILLTPLKKHCALCGGTEGVKEMQRQSNMC